MLYVNDGKVRLRVVWILLSSPPVTYSFGVGLITTWFKIIMISTCGPSFWGGSSFYLWVASLEHGSVCLVLHNPSLIFFLNIFLCLIDTIVIIHIYEVQSDISIPVYNVKWSDQSKWRTYPFWHKSFLCVENIQNPPY